MMRCLKSKDVKHLMQKVPLHAIKRTGGTIQPADVEQQCLILLHYGSDTLRNKAGMNITLAVKRMGTP